MAPTRYSLGAIVLHWLIAAALAFQIIFAESLEGPRGPDLFARFQLHKSVGITILLLSVLRVGWRLIAPRPAAVPGPKWAMTLSSLVHLGFYIVMIGAPLTGWILVSTSDIKVDTLLFGSIPWPNLPVPQWMGEPSEEIHEILPNVGIALLVLHVAGALRHQYLLGTPILARMLPGGRGKAIGAVALAAAIMLGGIVLGKIVDPKGASAAPAAKVQAEAEPVAAPAAAPEPAAAAEPLAAEEARAKPADEEASAPRTWAQAPGGRLGFTAQWNGEPVTGSFGKWSSNILFAPDALEASKVDVSIDLASVDTGDSQRDGTLTDTDFFDTSRFARASYRATRFTALGGDRYRADGTLTLRGVSKPVPLAFTLTIAGDKARARGTARIDRTSFGVGQGEYASTTEIAGPVAISFDFAATAKD
ncbi:YceI family protein [Blastomonas fulva]|uniref:YceI family protein n=1 Tax=Blastomonas fulva TaxID=1550728 RepID=UPI0025A46D9F|nr:YceI family protein [Blastomonas fulva]MDM7929586.1 YceI family protein [Blastomonas fulva]MDM7967393.1 YceI family protein [Blastomonas fulva]